MHISVVFFIFAIQAVCDGAPGHKYPVQPLLDGVSFDNVEKRALPRCTDKQRDKSDGCESWKKQGLCENPSYKVFMTETCYVTCENCELGPTPPPAACTEDEKDKSDGCPIWEKNGYCKNPSYKTFMKENCYATCGYCIVGPTPPPAVDENACLQAHNEKRSLHGASALVWDDELERNAQQWADHLKSIGDVIHSKGTGEGENLAWSNGTKYTTCEDAMRGWYDKEEPLYDYNNPGFSEATGHFTQVVWKDTKRVGVAMATKKDEYGFTVTYIVARFSPQGNIDGQFAENVKEKTIQAKK